jgi:hypothetical protein
MRAAKCKYHYAVRELQKNQDYYKKQLFVDNVLKNDSRDFWKEVNKMRKHSGRITSTIDSKSDCDEIAEIFASNYSQLYKSVPCNSHELDNIACKIEHEINSIDFSSEYVVNPNEIFNAIEHLKSNKHEGVCGLTSDFFINASVDMSVHLAILVTSMLIHGHVSSQLTTSTIIPIPKSNDCKNESANYRAISLSSIICKVIDLVIINRYGDLLATSPNQFGFKPKGSTAVCTMLVKETISYYRTRTNDVYCVFLDASKAFDKVHYAKLFSCLFERRLPIVFVRLLFTMYTNHSACVCWNAVYSRTFPIKNGVRQGGILSPILFCIYIDKLLLLLARSAVGCHIGKNFLGALAYADDITLIAPSPNAMRTLLRVCDEFAEEYFVTFNAKKTKCIYYPRMHCTGTHDDNVNLKPLFFVNGNSIEYVQKWPHLGHILNSELDDNDDIENRRIQTVKQINDVLCYFGKLDSSIKLKLLYSFCSSWYGCELWDPYSKALPLLCISWRKALKRIWNLPNTTHTNILYGLCCKRPIEVDIHSRSLSFIFKCINSDNNLVRSATRHVIVTSGSQSPIGKSFIYNCTFFGLCFQVPEIESNIGVLTSLKLVTDVARFLTVSADKIQLLFELIMVRDGMLNLCNPYASSLAPFFDSDELKNCIRILCTE